MILKIAWRNIWRSKLRSLVVMLAICAGTWSVLMLVSFTRAFVNNYVNNVIDTELGHIQIHHPDYAKNPILTKSISQPDSVTTAIAKMKGVKAATYRTTLTGMISSGHGVRGVNLIGIRPKAEKKVLGYAEMIVRGANVDTAMRHPVLIGKGLAEDLEVEPGDKVVLTFQDVNGNMVKSAFRISGLFKTASSGFDESHVFVPKKELDALTGTENSAQEIVVRCESDQHVASVVKMLKGDYPNLRIQSYEELAPEISLFKTQIKSSSYVYLVIFMFALIFGIINTMLMAVLERTRELGMLMAIGLTRIQTFGMIVCETIFLALVAAPVGMALGWITIVRMGKTGLDLSNWAEGMTQFGIATKIYPTLAADLFWEVGAAVALTALLASVYPAIKAVSLRPVEAIRKI